MLKKNNKKINKLINQALISKQEGNLIDAEKCLKKALKIDPENFIALNNIGNISSIRNKAKEAQNYFSRAINIKQDYSNAIFNLALVNEELGNKKKAIKLYKEAIKHDQENLGFYHNLSRIDETFFNNENIEIIKKILTNEKISYFNKSCGFFILANNQKKKENFKEEFEHLIEAHNFFHFSDEKINNQVSFYWIRLIPKVFEKFDLTFQKNLSKGVKPIFITGLPRSGSTLIESIISSGKRIIPNGGETGIINRVFLEESKEFFSKKEFLDDNKKLKIDEISFVQKTLDHYQLFNLLDRSKSGIFTDKSLENFFFIELIIKMFPEAKIINCERNILQIIISIYQNFLPNIKWSHSIDNILEYIDNYLKIIKGFKEKYPDKIFTVKLEDFIADNENLSKDLFRFCDLEWDFKCLEFYKRDDLFSKTASNQQIRNKIFNNDKKNYLNYMEFLRPYATKYEWLKELL